MIQYLYLGRVAYEDALLLQAELIELRQKGRIENILLLLEHPPVLTLGRNANRSNILASDELLARRGVTLHEINRGGDVTYHGPGQLIGYPIFDLRSLRNPANGNRLGPVDFVRLMEGALILLCDELGVHAGRICKLTGVWCHPRWSGPLDESCVQDANQHQCRPEAKIAAIGIHVARGVTSHGFALNVTTDLGGFGLINPCGITDRPVTSLEREMAQPADLPDLESMAHRAARQFGAVFEQPVQELASLAALREPAGASQQAAPEFPAEDTPLQVPAEIERLQGKSGRPVRA
jgi:lipoyl(octanoyl) transferase